MRLVLLLAGLLLAAPAAEARMHAPYRGHRIVPQASAPLDTFATPAAAYSMRRLKSSYTGPGIRLRRASDNTEQDINFLGFTGFTGAPIDTVAANAFCAATSCFLTAWYDQSGNARHWTQAGPAAQPAYVTNCQNGLPCARVNDVSQNMAFSNVTPSAILSLSAVGQHQIRPGGCTYMAASFSNILGQHATLDITVLQATGAINATAAGLQWHSHTGVMNGASSVVNIDGTETTGTVTPVAGAGPLYFSPGAAGATCNEAEAIYWDNYALTAGERTALRANQKSFWGTP